MSVISVTLPSGYQPGQFHPAFDPLETLPANVVPGEKQVIAANFGTDVQFFTPAYAPFFADTVTVQFTDSATQQTRTLVVGIDYYYAFPFIGASRASKKAVYGGIALTNNQVNGVVTITYHTVGGGWESSVAINLAVAQLLAIDPYVTAWEQMVDYAVTFPVVGQPWDRQDLVGIPQVVASILSLRDAVQQQTDAQGTQNAAALAHISNLANPHHDSAAQLGLDQVKNFPPATNLQAADPTNNTTYISPGQLGIAFSAGIPRASDTVAGLNLLNDGTVANADTDLTRALTAAGFLALADAPDNQLGQAFNKAQTEAVFHPYPFSFPATWNSNTYPDMATLLQAIRNFVGVNVAEFSSIQGKMWFPADVVPPVLTIT